MLLLLTHTGLGIYTAPIAMMAAFLIPSTAMFLRSQLGDKPIDFPYLAMLRATLVAVVIAVGFHFIHPAGEWMKLPVIAILMLVWFASLFVLRIIPKAPLASDPPHRAVGDPQGIGAQVRPGRRAGLAGAPERKALRAAVVDRLPPAALVPSTVDGHGASNGRQAGDGAKATKARRSRAATPTTAPKGRGWFGCCAAPASAAGSRSRSRASSTPASRCTCSPIEPVAVRLKKMRQLLSAGVSAHELRTLEDLRDDLARTSPKVWGVEPGNGRRRARNGKGRGRDGKGRGSGGRPRPSVKRA